MALLLVWRKSCVAKCYALLHCSSVAVVGPRENGSCQLGIKLRACQPARFPVGGKSLGRGDFPSTDFFCLRFGRRGARHRRIGATDTYVFLGGVVWSSRLGVAERSSRLARVSSAARPWPKLRAISAPGAAVVVLSGGRRWVDVQRLIGALSLLGFASAASPGGIDERALPRTAPGSSRI